MDVSSVLNVVVKAKGITSVNAALGSVQASLLKTAGAGQAAGGGIGKVAKGTAGVAALGAAAVVAGKQLYDLGEKFHSATNTIRVGTGATGKELEKLKNDMKAVYANTPAELSEVATSIADLNTRLGLSGKPLQEMALGMLRLSRFTDTDLKTNIKNVARAFVDWEVPVRKQAKALDGLYRLGQRSGATVADIALNIRKFGSPLRTLGWSVDEAAAMFANFERAGVNVQTMVPGLKLAIGNLVDPTDELKNKLKDLGVEAGNPEKALRKIMDLLGSGSDLKAMEKIDLAMDVFGKRAGADLAEAVRQGRFNLESYIKTFRDGKDDLKKTGEDVSTVGGQFTMLGHKLEVALEPLGTFVHDTVLDIAKGLNSIPLNKTIADVKRFTKTNRDFKSVMGAVSWVIRALGKAFQFGFGIAKEQVRGFWTYTKGVFTTLRGVVKVVSGVVTGDWRKAWSGIKDIFRGSVQIVLGIVRAMTAPLRAVTSKIGDTLGNVFEGAWDKVKGIFRGGANAVISVVNAVISAINVIPGIDIGKVGKLGGGEGSGYDISKGIPKGRQEGGLVHRATGGIVPGVGEGDRWRKDLPAGSFVLNKRATRAYGLDRGGPVKTILEPGERYFMPHEVRRIGLGKLQAMNEQVSRFQQGGPVGYIGGGIVDSVADAAGDIANSALGAAGSVGNKILSQGANFVLSKLPTPDIPQPFTGVGPAVIDAATEFIKGAVQHFVKTHEATNTGEVRDYMGIRMADWVAGALEYAAKKGVQPQPTSGYRTHAENVAAGRNYISEHEGTAYPHGAVDFGGYHTGYAAKMSVVQATRDYRYPLLAPIGFVDDGHASGTGHQKGGLVENPWFNASTKKGNINGIWPSADLAKNASGWYDLPTLPGYVIGALAEAAGRHFSIDVPGRTMMQMVMGEGGGKPGSQGTDPGGRTKGYGLWAVTTGFDFNDQLVKRFGGTYGHMNNPVLNAAAMAHIFKSQGTGAWYGDDYVTDFNADWKGAYQLKNALGGIGYSAALRSALRGKAQPGGGEMSAEEKEKLAAAHRLKARKKALAADIGRVGEAETARGKKSALWQVIMDYARWGVFGKKERRHTMDVVREVSAMANPLGGMKKLANLKQFLGKNVELTGADPDDFRSLEKIVENARDKGADIAEVKRKKMKNRIVRKGAQYPQKDDLLYLQNRMDVYDELIQRAQSVGRRPGSPAGTDYSEGEVQEQLGLLEFQLYLARRRRDAGFGARGYLRNYQGTLEEQIKKALPKSSSTHWKLGTLIAGKKAVGASLTNVNSDLQEMVGKSGKYGTIFQLKDQIANLVGTADSGVDSEMQSLLTGMLRDANMRNLVLSRQFGALQGLPYMGAYGRGGVAKVGEHGPELVGMPEGARVVSARETRRNAAGGIGDLQLVVSVYEDEDKAEATLVGPDFERKVEAVIERVNRKKGRSVGAVPGRGGVR